MRGSRSGIPPSLARFAILAAAVSACAAVLAGTPAANAQTSSRPSAPAATVHPSALVTRFVVPAGAAAVQRSFVAGRVRVRVAIPQQSVIVCTLNVQFPHKSTHVPETVNEVATVTCTSPVSELAMNVGMYFNGVLKVSKGFDNTGSAFIQGNVATPCVNGTYIGTADAAVLFPPGYEPPEGSIPQNYSPPQVIKC
jgi:hypothetical protein